MQGNRDGDGELEGGRGMEKESKREGGEEEQEGGREMERESD